MVGCQSPVCVSDTAEDEGNNLNNDITFLVLINVHSQVPGCCGHGYTSSAPSRGYKIAAIAKVPIRADYSFTISDERGSIRKCNRC